MVGDRDALLSANTRFYEAFSAGDLGAMDDLWAREAPVVCVHPGWALLEGRDAVMASFKGIFSGSPPDVTCSQPTTFIDGRMGMIVCHEHVGRLVLIATNLFVFEHGRWSMIHHHAAPVVPEPGHRKPATPPDDLKN